MTKVIPKKGDWIAFYKYNKDFTIEEVHYVTEKYGSLVINTYREHDLKWFLECRSKPETESEELPKKGDWVSFYRDGWLIISEVHSVAMSHDGEVNCINTFHGRVFMNGIMEIRSK